MYQLFLQIQIDYLPRASTPLRAAPIFNSDHHLMGILSGGGYIEDDTNSPHTNEPNINEPKHISIAFASKAIYIAKLLPEVITHLHQHQK